MLSKRTVDISTGVIFRTILILIGLWVIYRVRNIIAVLFVAVIFSAAIEQPVRRLTDKKIPRFLAVIIIFFILFFVFGTIISLLIPPIVSQFNEFTRDFPLQLEKMTQALSGLEYYFQSHGIKFSRQDFFNSLSNHFSSSSGEIFTRTVSVFTGLVSIVAVISLTFYLSIKEDGMKNFITSLTPPAHQQYVISLAEKIREKIGKWLQGQIFLMLIIFLLDFLALYLLGIPYALILAIFAGAMEIIPYLGPIVSAIPAVIVGFMVSPLTGLLVLLAYIIIQQFENHIIVPQVMKKAIGLNPVAVILALLIGAKLGGLLGAIIAVPLTAAASVIIKDLKDRQDRKAFAAEQK